MKIKWKIYSSSKREREASAVRLDDCFKIPKRKASTLGYTVKLVRNKIPPGQSFEFYERFIFFYVLLKL